MTLKGVQFNKEAYQVENPYEELMAKYHITV